MSKRSKKSRAIGRRTVPQTARTMPKSKAINPVVISIVAVAMVVVLLTSFGAAFFAGPTSGSSQSSQYGATTSSTTSKPIDAQEQQRIGNLEQSLKADPKNLGVLIELGNSYYDSQQFGKAIDPYSQALDIDPNNTNVRVDLGTSYLSLGMTSQAIKEYRKALEIDPQKPQAHLNLGNALITDNAANADEAVSEWQKAIQYAQGDPDTIKKAQDQIDRYKR